MKTVEYILKDNIYKDIKCVAESPFVEWDKLDHKKVMITGAAGFIGYYLVTSLLLRNDIHASEIQVYAIVRNLDRAERKFGDLVFRDDLTIVEHDVCDAFDDGVLGATVVDYIIHAASQASNIQFEQDPVGTIRANLTGTDNVLRFARKWNATVLIVSSLKVYGSVTDGSHELTEDKQGYIDIDSYKNCYAMGKRASETLAASYAKQYGMDIKIVRPSYIFGAASLDDDRVWAQFIANVVRGENILLKSNGATLRSFCYVSDTAAAIYKVLTAGDNIYPYNISDGKGDITIRGFAKKAVEAFPERELSLIFANPEDETEPVIDYDRQTPEIMNSSRLKGLGWEAQVDISEGVKRAVAILEEK